jgi:hypothetical protein
MAPARAGFEKRKTDGSQWEKPNFTCCQKSIQDERDPGQEQNLCCALCLRESLGPGKNESGAGTRSDTGEKTVHVNCCTSGTRTELETENSNENQRSDRAKPKTDKAKSWRLRK